MCVHACVSERGEEWQGEFGADRDRSLSAGDHGILNVTGGSTTRTESERFEMDENDWTAEE